MKKDQIRREFVQHLDTNVIMEDASKRKGRFTANVIMVPKGHFVKTYAVENQISSLLITFSYVFEIYLL